MQDPSPGIMKRLDGVRTDTCTCNKPEGKYGTPDDEKPLILLLLSLVDRGSKSNLISAQFPTRRHTCLSRNEAVFLPLTLLELLCQLDSHTTAR